MSKPPVRKGIPKKSAKVVEIDDSQPYTSFTKSFRDYKDDPKKNYEKEDAVLPSKKSIFDIIDDIKVHKTGTLLRDEEYKKMFNSYMVLHILSMNNSLCEIVNMVNEYQSVLDKEMMYKLLISIVPSGRSYDPYIRQEKIIEDSDVTLVAEYFEVGLKTARDYVKLMGKDWLSDIRNKFGLL